MSKILIPTTGPQDWQRLLAKPDLHWKSGKSARTLAHCWEASAGMPAEVEHLMADAFGPAQLLCAVPEHKTALPGGDTESQSDILALVRHSRGLATYTIEGKVDESFDKTVSTWSKTASSGKIERLTFLCATLGLQSCPPDLRYQLLHRTASALIEAERFDAALAGMIVHSFSPERRWFADFAYFVRLLGGGDAEPGQVTIINTPSSRPLALGWACGDEKFLEA